MSQTAGKPIPSAVPPSGLRVLVVDDERALADLVGSYLTRDGFEVSMAQDGQQAIDQARQVDPDVMVLDLGLPVIDGVEVCRVVRTFSDCYIVMLTARTEEIDKLIGLSVGADDYLTKPFSPRELVARIHAMLRRPRLSANRQHSQEAPPRVFGALSIDVAGGRWCGARASVVPLPAVRVLAGRRGVAGARSSRVWCCLGRRSRCGRRVVRPRVLACSRRPGLRSGPVGAAPPPLAPGWWPGPAARRPAPRGRRRGAPPGRAGRGRREVHLDGEAVALTRTEFDMLEALSARPKLVFSRRQLIDAVWDQAWVGDEHLVDVHVGHLREKLGDDPRSPRFVRTVRGVGYGMGEGR